MKVAIKTYAAIVLAAAALLTTGGTASADHTTRDLCAGVVEYDGCWYCAYQDGVVGQPPTNCHYGFFGYSWERCNLWVTDACVVGNIT